MKKAMSPLVATVVLIAFAIGLGTVVMSFGSTYYENSKFSSKAYNESILCQPISLQLFSVRDEQQICLVEKGIKFVLVNNANNQIDGVQMWVVGESIFVTDVTNKTFQPGYPLEGMVSYDSEKYGAIRNVQFIPRVKVPGTEETFFCFDKAVTADEVRYCQ
ncbi:MAG: archaellin/type IV pilin N-terminal domain-containing protein [Candidatus Woesearchaeota archaeon]